MDFTVVETIKIKTSDLQHKFDVRVDGSVNQKATEQIVAQGGPKRNPLVTKDLVSIDGRTGADAAAQLYALKNNVAEKDALIDVDVVSFYYNKLTIHQKAEVQAEALRLNMPNNKQGYRRFATEDDIKAVLQGYVAAGFSLEESIKLLPFASPDQIKRLHKSAQSSYDQQLLARTRSYMKDNPRKNTEEAAKATGLPKRLVSSVIKDDNKKWNVSLREKQEKQDAVKSTLESVERYANTNIEGLRSGKLSAKMVLEYNDWNIKQCEKLMKKLENIKTRAAREAASLVPEFHTR